jgi:toxin ParE1/3/4
VSLNLLRSGARQDIARILQWYEANAGPDVAMEFLEAAEKATLHILAFPESGSPIWQSTAAMKDLRAWPIKGFPYLAFYFGSAKRPDVIRILHTSRDIPSQLRE